MKHFSFITNELSFFKSDYSEVKVCIERSSANIYTLKIKLLDTNGSEFIAGEVVLDTRTETHDTPITMKILQDCLAKMITTNVTLRGYEIQKLVAFQEQFNRTNPRKRISKLLKSLTNGLRYQHERHNWYSRHKGNMVIELVRRNYVDLAESVDEQDNDDALIKLHVVVDKLGDYSFVIDYRFLVGENIVPGRVILKEKVKDIDDFVSLTRKGLLVAKQRGKLTVKDVESFYKDILLFATSNEDDIREIIDRMNARLPV